MTLEQWKSAIASNKVDDAITVMKDPQFNKTWTFEELGIIGDFIEQHLDKSQALKLMSAATYYGVMISKEQNNVQITKPLILVNENQNSPNALLVNPKFKVIITDLNTGEAVTIPLITYSLIIKSFDMFYSLVLQDDLNSSLLRITEDVKTAYRLTKQFEQDSLEADFLAEDVLEFFLSMDPQLVRYVNFNLLSQLSEIFAPTITETVGGDLRIFRENKFDSKLSQELFGNAYFIGLVRAIEAKDEAQIGRNLDGLKETPTLFSLLNLGQVFKISQELGIRIAQYIADHGGSAYGDIFQSAEEGSKITIKSLLSYAYDENLEELANILTSQPEISLDSPKKVEVKPGLFLQEPPSKIITEYFNNVDANTGENISVTTLIHLIMTNRHAALRYIEAKNPNLLETGLIDGTSKSALKMLIDSARGDVGPLLRKAASSSGWDAEGAYAEIATTPEIVQEMLDSGIDFNHDLFSVAAQCSSSFLINMIEAGKWDIVKVLVGSEKVKLVSTKIHNGAIVDNAFDLLIASGRYTIDELMSLPSLKCKKHNSQSIEAIIAKYPTAAAVIVDSILEHADDASQLLDSNPNIIKYAIMLKSKVAFKALDHSSFDSTKYTSEDVAYAAKISEEAAVKLIDGGAEINMWISQEGVFRPLAEIALENNLTGVINAILRREDADLNVIVEKRPFLIEFGHGIPPIHAFKYISLLGYALSTQGEEAMGLIRRPSFNPQKCNDDDLATIARLDTSAAILLISKGAGCNGTISHVGKDITIIDFAIATDNQELVEAITDNQTFNWANKVTIGVDLKSYIIYALEQGLWGMLHKALSNPKVILFPNELMIFFEALEQKLEAQGQSVHEYLEEYRIFANKVLIAAAQTEREETIKRLVTESDARGNDIFTVNAEYNGDNIGMHYTINNPWSKEMLAWLFEHGYIPRGNVNVGSANIDNVYHPKVIHATNIYIKMLVEQQASVTEINFDEEASKLHGKFQELLDRVSDTDSGFDSLVQLSQDDINSFFTSKKDLTSQDAVKLVITRAQQALTTSYLVATDHRSYHKYYYENHNAHFMSEIPELQQKYVTNTEMFGRIKYYLEHLEMSHAIAVDVFLEVIGGCKDKDKLLLALKAQLGFNGLDESTNESLANVDVVVLDDIVHEMQHIRIIEIFRMKNFFKYATQLFIASTTYGEEGEVKDASACGHGTSVHAARTLPNIDHKFVEAVCDRQPTINDKIDENNVGDIPQIVAGALIDAFSNGEGVPSPLLEDFMSGLEIKPSEIDHVRQRFFAVVNTVLIREIRKIKITGGDATEMEDLDRVPTVEEYGLLLKLIRTDKILVEFMAHYYESHPDSDFEVTVHTKANMESMKAASEKQQIKIFLRDLLSQIVEDVVNTGPDAVEALTDAQNIPGHNTMLVEE